jgi:predicted RND superfamily exporter protein
MKSHTELDRAIVKWSSWVIRKRWVILLVTLLFVIAAGSGVRFLAFSSDYRNYFSENNPQLNTFDELQQIYTKNDNIFFLLAPKDGEVFTPRTLHAVERLTEEAWQIPYAIRVNSVTNFQHTYANGDELIVADLMVDARNASPGDMKKAKTVALTEPLLVKRLVSEEAHVTGVNVTVQLPGKSIDEVPAAAAEARALAERIRAEFPDIDVYITGIVMLNDAFVAAGMGDMQFIVPLMYLVIALMIGFLLRSVSAVFATVALITLASAAAMGLAGWFGVQLMPTSGQATTMIMMLAVADSIHILTAMLAEMRRGRTQDEAIVESIRVNFIPVFLTSLTTVIGFLSMNFSDSPPYRDLGNITAVGIAFAFALSVTFLPAFMSILRVKVRIIERRKTSLREKLAAFVIRHRHPVLWGSAVIVLALAAFIPANDLNDDWVAYIDKRIQFRTDTDFSAENLSGLYQIEHSLGAGGSGGVSDPAYLQKLDEFANWYRKQPGVTHVNSYSEIMKRLNMNLHGDDPAYYRIPDNRELAAQYLLLYEMSLPYGLDLNNQINVDKSATRLTVTTENLTSQEVRELASQAEDWLSKHAPASMFALGTSPSLMFAHITERNVKSMAFGTMIAILLISIVLAVALRSIKHGLISIIPNLVPMLLGFGLWGIFVGQVGLALSTVAGMAMGLVVDDTVHFLSKYLRTQRENRLDVEEAVRSVFASVGPALVVTTAVLVAGFLVMSSSLFQMNSNLGQVTVITIVLALVADFLLLPALLLAVDGKKRSRLVK